MIMELITYIAPDNLYYHSQKNTSSLLLPFPIRIGFIGGLQ